MRGREISYEGKDLSSLKAKFKEESYVHLPNFFEKISFTKIATTIADLLADREAKDFIMPGSNTRRYLKTIGAIQLKEQFPHLFLLYPKVKKVVRAIVGEELFDCKDPEEMIAVNHLHAMNATHGWHLDDPPFVIVVGLESPSDEQKGGVCEMIPNCLPTDDVEKFVLVAQKKNLIKKLFLEPNDAYLIKGSETLHRVTPLEESGSIRTAVLMSYESSSGVVYGDTAKLLYSHDEPGGRS
jgi:hypothetical protein